MLRGQLRTRSQRPAAERGLDSEGDDERSRFEGRRASRVRALTRLVWRGRHLKTGNDLRVAGTLVRSAAHVLSCEEPTDDHHLPAALIPPNAGRCPVTLGVFMALCHRRATGMAPHSAQERSFLANCQQQHDRDDGCSKHRRLALIVRARVEPGVVSVDRPKMTCF